MKLTKSALIKLIKEEISNHFSEEMEHQPIKATWRDSETEAGGFVELFVPATTRVEDLEKVAADLEKAGIKSITEDGQPEISVLDFLKTKLLYSNNPPDLG